MKEDAAEHPQDHNVASTERCQLRDCSSATFETGKINQLLTNCRCEAVVEVGEAPMIVARSIATYAEIETMLSEFYSVILSI